MLLSKMTMMNPPLLTIDDSKLNIRQMGEYEVYYHVKDASGNEDTLIRKVEVLCKSIR